MLPLSVPTLYCSRSWLVNDAHRATRKCYAYYTHLHLHFKKNRGREDFYSGLLVLWLPIFPENLKYGELVNCIAGLLVLWLPIFPENLKHGEPVNCIAGLLVLWLPIFPENLKYGELVNCITGLLATQKTGKMVCWISIFRAHSALFAARNGLQPAV